MCKKTKGDVFSEHTVYHVHTKPFKKNEYENTHDCKIPQPVADCSSNGNAERSVILYADNLVLMLESEDSMPQKTEIETKDGG